MVFLKEFFEEVDFENISRRQKPMKNYQLCKELIDFILFIFSGVHNLLSYLGVYKLPLGVSTIPDRHDAFNISSRAKLFTPLNSIYTKELPHDFSLLMTLKFPQNYSGYYFTLSDLTGKQRFALQYAADTLTVQYFDQNEISNTKSPTFDVNFSDGFWHKVALSVSGYQLELYLDCDTVIVKDLHRSQQSILGSNLMLALGPYFARYGSPFEVSYDLTHLYQRVLTFSLNYYLNPISTCWYYFLSSQQILRVCACAQSC